MFWFPLHTALNVRIICTKYMYTDRPLSMLTKIITKYNWAKRWTGNLRNNQYHIFLLLPIILFPRKSVYHHPIWVDLLSFLRCIFVPCLCELFLLAECRVLNPDRALLLEAYPPIAGADSLFCLHVQKIAGSTPARGSNPTTLLG